MRYLFVYQDFGAQAEALVIQAGVTDVVVVRVKKGEDAPSVEVLAALGQSKPACAACQVARGYRKVLSTVAAIEYEPKFFRSADQQLLEWLKATPAVQDEPVLRPSEVFKACVAECPHLLLARGALDVADETDPLRWPFVQRAARLLMRHANGENVGAMRDWKANHRVDYATNSRVIFKGGPVHRPEISRWHLKEGDHTTAELAARIYFDCLTRDGEQVVVVFYVGPHPAVGVHQWEY